MTIDIDLNRKSLGNCVYVRDGKIYQWEVSYLWKISEGKDVMEIPIQQLFNNLDQRSWFYDTNPPSVIEMLSHCRRIVQANLEYPIIIDKYGIVIDGLHRLAKAYIEDKKSIKAVCLDPLPPSQM